MRLIDVLVLNGMARSKGEASRLVKQGAVSVGGCDPSCYFFSTGYCSCKKWTKILDPLEEIVPGLCVKVSSGHWRLVNRLSGPGYDQVRGIGRAPE